MAVTNTRAPGVSTSGGSRARRNARFRVGDVVREGMHVGTVTDVGTMLVKIETTMGTSRMVCPWELVRLRAAHDGRSVDSAHKSNAKGR
jgi:hypothetical protein